MKHYWRIALGLVISIVLLWLAIRGVDWVSFAAALQAVSWLHCGVAGVLFVANLVVRAVRWQTLLVPTHRTPLLEVFAYAQIGYLANALLPLRAGELIRPVLLGQRYNISKGSVLATVAVERVLDVLTLVFLAFVLLVVMDVPVVVRQSALLTSVLAIAAFVALWVLAWRKERVQHISDRVFFILPGVFRDKLVSLVVMFTRGLQSLQSSRHTLSLAGCSLAAWALVTWEIWFILRGFDLALPWYAALFIVIVLNLGMAIPSSPGFIGVAHFLVVWSLAVFAIGRSEALSVAFLVHGINFILNVILGFVFLWRENIAFSRLSKVTLNS